MAFYLTEALHLIATFWLKYVSFQVSKVYLIWFCLISLDKIYFGMNMSDFCLISV